MSIEKIDAAARAEGRELLTEVEAKAVLSDAGVPVARTVLATTVEEAQAEAAHLGIAEHPGQLGEGVEVAFARQRPSFFRGMGFRQQPQHQQQVHHGNAHRDPHRQCGAPAAQHPGEPWPEDAPAPPAELRGVFEAAGTQLARWRVMAGRVPAGEATPGGPEESHGHG